VFTFNYADYACGQEYYVFAWASNEFGQSEQYSTLPGTYTTPACYS
jgi:hypothetical protein